MRDMPEAIQDAAGQLYDLLQGEEVDDILGELYDALIPEGLGDEMRATVEAALSNLVCEALAARLRRGGWR